MRQFFKMFLLAGVSFGLFMAAWVTLHADVPSGLIAGFASGTFFGLALAGFGTYQRRQSARERPPFEDEILLKEGPANHFQNLEGVGGWLYLTDRRLLFRSHKFNIQVHELSIPLQEVIDVQPARTLRVIPNGLLVVTPYGNEQFVVKGRHAWAEAIRDAVPAAERGR